MIRFSTRFQLSPRSSEARASLWRSHAGSGGAVAIVIGLIVFGIAAALVVSGLINTSLARSEEQEQACVNVAEAGLHQFLHDVEAGIVSPSLTVDQVRPNGGGGPPPPDPFQNLFSAGAQAAVTGIGIPYPWPAAASFLASAGQAYISFNPGSPYPYSTSNLFGTTGINGGWNGRTVPAYSVDVISTGVVGGRQRSIAVRVNRIWPYAVTAAHQVFLTGAFAGGPNIVLPAQVSGNLFTLDGTDPVEIGVDRTGLLWGGCVVTGTIATPGSTVSVDVGGAIVPPASPPYPGGCAIGGVHTGARVLQYPVILPPPPGGTDLSTTTIGGCYLNQTGPTSFTLEYNPALAGAGAPAQAHLGLSNGSFFVPGSLSITGTSNCLGVQLQNAVLHVEGDLTFTQRVTSISGDGSALAVDGDMDLEWAFLDGGTTNGLVVSARNITTLAGGTFHGIVLCPGTLTIQPVPTNPGANVKMGALPQYGAREVGLGPCPPICIGPGSGPGLPCPPVCVPAPPPAAVGSSRLAMQATVAPEQGFYPLRIVGAILSPNTAPPYQQMDLCGVQVQYSAQFVTGLNLTAPLNISSKEILH